ncbi:MAG: hypothetical protein H6816_13025 [Phycisphaerales bacterium]|nr:hypothetical protein [Phycisphaerales bacterium]
MIARFAGGMLGLLAFGVAATIGLAVGNPPLVVVSRALWALAIFCIVGLAVGAAAQAVVNEYIAAQEEALRSPAGERAANAGSAEKSAGAAVDTTVTE